jgi:hypothetical protein
VENQRARRFSGLSNPIVLWLASSLRGSAQCLIGIETAVADGLSAMRGPGDSHSDVILRLVEIEAKAGR